MSKGNVLQDDDGTIDERVIPRAACYVSGPAATTITVAGTYYPLAGTSTVITASFFTHTSPGRLTYTGIVSRHLKVSVKLSATSSTNNVTITVRIAKNGVTDPSSTQTFFKTTSSDIKGLNAATLVNFSQGDYVEVYATADAAGSTITANDATLIVTL